MARFIGVIIMTLIGAYVASYTTPSTASSGNLMGIAVIWPLLLMFLIIPFPVEALLKAQINKPQNAKPYQFFIFLMLLLPFSLMFWHPSLFITALVSAVLLMVFSYFMSETYY